MIPPTTLENELPNTWGAPLSTTAHSAIMVDSTIGGGSASRLLYDGDRMIVYIIWCGILPFSDPGIGGVQ